MSFVRHSYHIIFSTKGRERVIRPELESELFSYIGGIIREADGVLIEMGADGDHVHILTRLHQSRAVSDVVRNIKSGSSRWMNENHKMPRHFQWQSKYGSFTVSRSMEGQVGAYIQGQKEHHRSQTFKEEFLGFLKKHDVSFDERYIWE